MLVFGAVFCHVIRELRRDVVRTDERTQVETRLRQARADFREGSKAAHRAGRSDKEIRSARLELKQDVREVDCLVGASTSLRNLFGGRGERRTVMRHAAPGLHAHGMHHSVYAPGLKHLERHSGNNAAARAPKPPGVVTVPRQKARRAFDSKPPRVGRTGGFKGLFKKEDGVLRTHGIALAATHASLSVYLRNGNAALGPDHPDAARGAGRPADAAPDALRGRHDVFRRPHFPHLRKMAARTRLKEGMRPVCFSNCCANSASGAERNASARAK